MKLLMSTLDAFAPFETACGFDHCGLLVGGEEQAVSRVGVALDVTPAVLAEAKKTGCDVIVTHHPVIFHPLAALEPQGMAYQLVQAGIACIAMHTNLDKAAGGTNDIMASLAGLSDIESPAVLEELGRLGVLKTPAAVPAYIDSLKAAFGADMLRYYDAGHPVSRVVTVAGSGGDFLETACLLGADTVITGDVKHDRFVEAQIQGINLIELNHSDAERAVLPALAAVVQAAGFDVALLDCPVLHAR